MQIQTFEVNWPPRVYNVSWGNLLLLLHEQHCKLCHQQFQLCNTTSQYLLMSGCPVYDKVHAIGKGIRLKQNHVQRLDLLLVHHSLQQVDSSWL